LNDLFFAFFLHRRFQRYSTFVHNIDTLELGIGKDTTKENKNTTKGEEGVQETLVAQKRSEMTIFTLLP
jgi:hypothetical protein